MKADIPEVDIRITLRGKGTESVTYVPAPHLEAIEARLTEAERLMGELSRSATCVDLDIKVRDANGKLVQTGEPSATVSLSALRDIRAFLAQSKEEA